MNLEELVEKQKREIEKLKREKEEIIDYFSVLEVRIASKDEFQSRDSASYFSELLDNYIASKPHRSKLEASRKTGIPRGRLYDLANGKRPFSDAHIEAIRDGLEITQEEYETLKGLVEEDKRIKSKFKEQINERLSKQTDSDRHKANTVKLEAEMEVYTWLHYAILSMFKMDDKVKNREWISETLGMPHKDLSPIINSLIDLGHLTEEDGKMDYNPSVNPPITQEPEANRQKFKELVLGQINEAVNIYNDNNMPFENKEKGSYGGFFVAGDSEKVEIAGKMLHESIVKIGNFLATGKRDKLFSVTYQLGPLSK